MSSTIDSECPPAVSEMAYPPGDSYPDSESPARLKNAKNIGTTTPEVEGEDNEPVTTVEDYPSTPVSTMDSLFQALPLTGESKEDSTPLPPTPEEPEFGVSKEAGATSLPSPIEAEEKHFDGAEEPKAGVLEGSDKPGDETDSKSAEGREVDKAGEKVGVLESSETEQGLSGDKAVDLKTGEVVEEGSTSEAAIPEPRSPEGEHLEAVPGANEEEPAAVDEKPNTLDSLDLDAGALKAGEPVEGNDGEARDVQGTEVVTEKLPSEVVDNEQDNTEAQTIQDSELAGDEPKAGEAAYENGEGDKVQREHEAKEAEHSEATELALGSTGPNAATTGHIPDAVMEVVVEKREDEEVEPGAEKTDTTIGGHESKPEPEAAPVTEVESLSSPGKDSILAEGSEMAQPGAEDLEAQSALELVASSGAEESEVPVEPMATKPTEAEPPTDDLLLTEPQKEDISVSSTVGEDSPDFEPATESTEGAKEDPRPETNELVEAEQQVAGMLPVTKPSKDEDDSLPVAADTEAEREPKETVEVETEYEVEEEPKFETVEVSEPVSIEPAVPDAPPLTEAPKEGEVPSVDVDASTRSEPAEESKEGEKGVLKAEPLVEGLVETAEETVGSTSEEPKAREGAGVPVVTGAPLDDSPTQELKEVIAAEPEAPAALEQPMEPEETKELQNASEFAEQSVARVKEMGPEPDIPKDNEQGAQEAVQATPVLDEAPTVIVEKTVGSQPSHGEGLGPSATEGREEAIEKREADAEPDVTAAEEPSALQASPAGESTLEPTPDDSEEASPEPTNGANANRATSPATDSAANGGGEDLVQDEPVVVSHGDAPPDEVERAEAAVEYPKLDPQEEVAEAPKEIEVEKDGEPPVLPEQAQTEHEGAEEVAEAATGSPPLNEPQPFETPGGVAPERAPTPKVTTEENLEEPKTEELGIVVLTEMSDEAKEPTSPKEPGVVAPDLTTPEGTRQVVKGEAPTEDPEEKEQEFSVLPLPASQTIGNPIDLAPGEETPEDFNVSVDTIQAEDNPSEPVGAKPSETLLPVIEDVKPTVQSGASTEPQPEEQIFSVSPLPDSKTFGNPTDPQPGEPIPVCLTEASVADHVKLDEEIFKKFDGKAPVAEEAGAEESDGLGAYATVERFDDKTEADKHSSEKASSVAASSTVPKVGDIESPAVGVSVKSIPSTAQEQALPVEVSFTSPAVPKELSDPPVSKMEIEPAHPVDKSAEEIIKPAGAEVLDGSPLQASTIDIPGESAVSQPVGKSVSDKGDEAIAEPVPQNVPSPVHGVAAPEEHIPKVLQDMESSETPAIVVSAPPNPATGSSAAEVIQPSSLEIAFDEASANKARESENTPEGVRRRRTPGPGGQVSRPTSSGTDTVSTRHHRNIMNGFWHVVLFGWLGGFGRFFGGIFSKSKSRKQRK
ncbi:hypothetical protein C7212DRAFT_350823 [Tuber magnatum]|uniref:Uncharacterized protein n=1 Tax=Tuber magnatum TaxID=42249 RepID=A0A317SXE9_9PEZI|nr:hypothetical protein C7212DRAFT_350823 [Tuber magnatum]